MCIKVIKAVCICVMKVCEHCFYFIFLLFADFLQRIQVKQIMQPLLPCQQVVAMDAYYWGYKSVLVLDKVIDRFQIDSAKAKKS